MSEITKLEGGQGSHVIVGAVSANSKAYKAGVRPGHALVVLNGHTEFARLPGWQVRLLLEAPITLGFDPAPGHAAGMPPSVELRLAPSPASRPLGIPADRDLSFVAGNGGESKGEGWVVAEEVSFKPTNERDDFLYGAEKDMLLSCWRPVDLRKKGSFHEVGPRPVAPTRERSPEVKSPRIYSHQRGVSPRDRSPLRWLAPVFGQFMGTVCADGSDDELEGNEGGERLPKSLTHSETETEPGVLVAPADPRIARRPSRRCTSGGVQVGSSDIAVISPRPDRSSNQCRAP